MATNTRPTKPPMDRTRKALSPPAFSTSPPSSSRSPPSGSTRARSTTRTSSTAPAATRASSGVACIEILTALTGIGTAVALYAVLKRYAPGRAIGFVASRTLEAATIVAGVVAVLAVYTLRQTRGRSCRADHHRRRARGHDELDLPDGPGCHADDQRPVLRHRRVPDRLVPRWIPTLGLIGAPLLLVSRPPRCSAAGTRSPAIGALLALPIAAWEFTVGVYMTVKGFRTPPAAEIVADESARPAVLAPA